LDDYASQLVAHNLTPICRKIDLVTLAPSTESTAGGPFPVLAETL